MVSATDGPKVEDTLRLSLLRTSPITVTLRLDLGGGEAGTPVITGLNADHDVSINWYLLTQTGRDTNAIMVNPDGPIQLRRQRFATGIIGLNSKSPVAFAGADMCRYQKIQ